MCVECRGYNSNNCPVCSKEVEYIPCPNCEGNGHIYYDDNEYVTENIYQGFSDSQKSFFHKIECETCDSKGYIEKDEDLSNINLDDVVRCPNDFRIRYTKPSTLEYSLSDLEYFEKEIA